MAFTGSIHNKRPGAGVYPGAGVARGGTQGRMNIMHNGVGAQGGGYTPGATGKRFVKPGSSVKPVPINRFNTGARGHVANASRFVAPHRAPVTATPPVPATPVTPTAGPVAPAPYVPQFELHDSNYFNDLAGIQRGLDDQLNPIQGELSRLQYRGIGGKTLYERMYEQAQRQFQLGVRDARGDAAKSGLLRSGRFDRTAGDLSSGWVDQQAQLDDELGGGALNRLHTQEAQARASFAEQQRSLELAAAERARQRLADYNASIYGQTIMPEEN